MKETSRINQIKRKTDLFEARFHERRSRSLRRSRKSAYDLVKIKNRSRSGVISATESSSEESERFPFLPTPPRTPSVTI